MKLEYLQEFCVLVEEGNYALAAERLNVSTTALSQHILKLEEELGQTLFVNEKRKTVLTSFGTFFFPYAQSIWGDYEKYLTDNEQLFQNMLCVGVSSMFKAYGVDRLINNFLNDNPNLKFSLAEDPVNVLNELCSKNQCDAAIIIIPVYPVPEWPTPEDLVIKDLYTEPLVVILRPDHPLAKKERIDIDELREESFVTCPILPSIYPGFEFNPHFIYYNYGVLENVGILTEHFQHGLAIMQRQEALWLAQNHNLCVRPLTPYFDGHVRLIYRKSNRKKSLRAFLHYVTQHYDEICAAGLDTQEPPS